MTLIKQQLKIALALACKEESDKSRQFVQDYARTFYPSLEPMFLREIDEALRVRAATLLEWAKEGTR